MLKSAWCKWILCASLLGMGQVVYAQNHVAVYYDDSGSMLKPVERWLAANYSLQMLAAVMNEQDEILLTKMTNIKQVQSLQGSSSIQQFLQQMQQEAQPSGNTPYEGISQLVQALAKKSTGQKWLVVITDGKFSVNSSEQLKQDMHQARQLGIKPIFVLIEQGADQQIANLWTQHTGSETVLVDDVSQLPKVMEQLAAKITGRDAQGLVLQQQAQQVAVQSIFPLRNLIVLTQGATARTLTQAEVNGQMMKVSPYQIQLRQPSERLLSHASVSHLNLQATQGDVRANLQFDGALEQIKLAVLPEVAGHFQVDVFDAQQQPLQPNAQGSYQVCQGDVLKLHSRLVDDQQQPLVKYSKDIKMFDVGFQVSQAGKTQNIQSQLNEQTQQFETDFVVDGSGFLHPYAKYQGYFNFQQKTIHVQQDECQREISIELATPLDAQGQWTQDVRYLGENTPLIYRVNMNGKPVAKATLEKWQWQYDADKWNISYADGQVILTPTQNCCAIFWNRQSEQKGQLQLALHSQNSRDTIHNPQIVPYHWYLPEGMAKYWWLYACPLLSVFALCFLLWYLYRIVIVKERFGRKASLHLRESGREVREPLVRQKNLLKHWLWPSRYETKVYRGLTFQAVGRGGRAVLVKGKGLTAQHEIDNWLYDPDKTLQPDATLRDGDILTQRHEYRQAVSYQIQYTQSNRSNWPQRDIF